MHKHSVGIVMYMYTSWCVWFFLSYTFSVLLSIVFHTQESEEGVEVVCGLTVVHLPSLDELAFVQQLGVADLKQSLKTMELCIEGCRRMHERLKKFLMGEK